MAETISVVIPCRKTDVPTETIESLFAQTYKHLEFIVIVDADDHGQGWARNKGLGLSRRRLVLFSDYDCRWEPDAVALLYDTLRDAQDRDRREKLPYRAAYAYGGYSQIDRGIPVLTFGLEPWSWPRLVQSNFISTMSLVDASLLAAHECL